MRPQGVKSMGPWFLFIKEMPAAAKIMVLVAAVALVDFCSKVNLSLLVHDERPKEVLNIEVVHLTTALLAPDLDIGRFFSDTTYAPTNLLLETPEQVLLSFTLLCRK
jgi:hypothetical protein